MDRFPPNPFDGYWYSSAGKPWRPDYLQGSQVTSSASHPAWFSKNRGGDIGGPFLTVKREASLIGGNSAFDLSGPSGGELQRILHYEGLCVPNTGEIEFPPATGSAESILNVWGASAIAKCKPTNIFVDLSASLGEFMREGVPSIGTQTWRDVTSSLRTLGKDHLAIEFGFKPIISDVYKTLLAREKTRRAIAQYVRDSGKMVRRRFEDKVQTEVSLETVRTGGRAIPLRGYSDELFDNVFGTSGKTVRLRKTEIRRWFAGAFTYHLPIDNLDYLGADDLFDRGLISLDLTPETLWNLAPWSWAVDWIVPMGDLIGNLQDWSTDGLVLRYGYAMETAVTTDIYNYVGQGGERVGALKLVTSSKQRIQANPFGFGMSWEALSARQLAILAALGITR
jgi:hypothetical protein